MGRKMSKTLIIAQVDKLAPIFLTCKCGEVFDHALENVPSVLDQVLALFQSLEVCIIW